MYKLAKKSSGGQSAAEILEATKKLYVKTELLIERKIDPSEPRIFKTPSEEEIELLSLKKVQAVPYRVSNVVSISPPLNNPNDLNGVSFCITSAPVKYNPLRNSEISAFRPFIKTPPRPPKSAKIRQKFMSFDKPTTSCTPPPVYPRKMSNTNAQEENHENKQKPTPPPRPSLQNQKIHPIPKPRRKTTVFTELHSSNLYDTNARSTPDLSELPMGKYSSIPYSSLMFDQNSTIPNDSMVTSMVTINLKPIDVMSTSWAPDNDFMRPKQMQKRLRVPVRPTSLAVAADRAPIEAALALNSSAGIDLADLTPMSVESTEIGIKMLSKPTNDDSNKTPSTINIKRSHSSITPLMRTNHFHSPGATSGIGSERCSSEQNSSSSGQIGPLMSSPATSRDSGVPEVSGGSSSDEFEIQHVDKDFEERIKRWDSRSMLRRYRSSPKLFTFRAEPFREKSAKIIDKIDIEKDAFFDEPFMTDAEREEKSESALKREASFLDELNSSEGTASSMFTSVSNRVNHLAPPVTTENESTADTNSSVPGGVTSGKAGGGKQVSIIEKNARVIQWIHGCGLASTVC